MIFLLGCDLLSIKPMVACEGDTRIPDQVAVAVGAKHACSLDLDGAIRCWGSEVPGELGAGGWAAITAGDGFTCATDEGGQLACVGVEQPEMTVAEPREREKVLDAGADWACALDGAGSPTCFGTGAPDPTDEALVDVSVGEAHACGVRLDSRSIVCWGATTLDVLDRPYQHVAAGTTHTCGLDTEGGVLCWGDGPGLDARRYETVAVGDGVVCGVTSDALVCEGAIEPPAGNFTTVDVALDGTVACAVGTDTKITCFGDLEDPRTASP